MSCVVLDMGHGPGSTSPRGATFGRFVERELVEDYVGAAIDYLTNRGVAVTLRRAGPYEDRQTGWQVDGADLYVSCHVNSADPLPRTPYALGLYYHTAHAITSAEIMAGFASHVKIDRYLMGVAGSKDWPRGASCIKHVPEHVPAMIFEPFLINHDKHSRFRSGHGLESIGVGLAKGILRALK